MLYGVLSTLGGATGLGRGFPLAHAGRQGAGGGAWDHAPRRRRRQRRHWRQHVPALVGVVKDGPDPSGQPKRLRVILAGKREVVMVIVAVLKRPHPPLVAEGDAREGDEVHGLGLSRDLAGFGGLEQNHLQQAGGQR